MVGKNNVSGGRSGLGGSIHRIAEGYAAPTFVGASDCPGWKRSILHPDSNFGRDTLGSILSAVKAACSYVYGGAEILAILFLAGIVLGSGRKARAGREPGKLVRNMKAYFNLLNIELKSELDILDQIKEVKEKIEKPIREINRMK
jgi:Sec-independent protein translocase protein TatA